MFLLLLHSLAVCPLRAPWLLAVDAELLLCMTARLQVSVAGLKTNPIVVVVSLTVTVAVLLSAVVQPDEFFDGAAEAKRLVTKNFTWLFIGAQNIWVLFIIYLWLTPGYYNMKMGAPEDRPEFNKPTW